MADKLIMANSPDEAVSSKTATAVFLAGGTEVNRLGSELAEKADTLISLKKCAGLSDIEEAGDHICIGSMCTFQQLAGSASVPDWLKESALFMASRTKRNMATIGGNIAAARSDSYIIPALYAAGAELEILCREDKAVRIGIDEYLDRKSDFDDSLITCVIVPKELRLVSKRYANTAQSHAVLTMSAAMKEDGIHMAGAVKNAGILHFCDLEKAFSDDPGISEEAVIKMVKECAGLHTADDMFGSDEYKRYLIAVTAYDLHRRLK